MLEGWRREHIAALSTTKVLLNVISCNDEGKRVTREVPILPVAAGVQLN
jgi:hypothetical protein